MEKIKIGIFGVGRGTDIAANFMMLNADIVAICDKYGIGYTAWDYKGSFGIIRNGKTQHEMIKALTGK